MQRNVARKQDMWLESEKERDRESERERDGKENK